MFVGAKLLIRQCGSAVKRIQDGKKRHNRGLVYYPRVRKGDLSCSHHNQTHMLQTGAAEANQFHVTPAPPLCACGCVRGPIPELADVLSGFEVRKFPPSWSPVWLQSYHSAARGSDDAATGSWFSSRVLRQGCTAEMLHTPVLSSPYLLERCSNRNHE